MLYFIKKKQLNYNYLKKENTKNVKNVNTTFNFLGIRFKLNMIFKIAQFLNLMYGIGYKKFIFYFLAFMGFSFNFLFIHIPFFLFQYLQFLLRFLLLNYDLKKLIYFNISKQIRLKLNTGYRHLLFLPVRGQRTQTNASTQKKKKITKNNTRVRKRKRK